LEITGGYGGGEGLEEAGFAEEVGTFFEDVDFFRLVVEVFVADAADGA
jgi:hypothetical protein